MFFSYNKSCKKVLFFPSLFRFCLFIFGIIIFGNSSTLLFLNSIKISWSLSKSPESVSIQINYKSTKAKKQNNLLNSQFISHIVTSFSFGGLIFDAIKILLFIKEGNQKVCEILFFFKNSFLDILPSNLLMILILSSIFFFFLRKKERQKFQKEKNNNMVRFEGYCITPKQRDKKTNFNKIKE